MKIIITGIGKLGEYLTRSLVENNNEITIVDKDFTTTKDLINNVDVNYVTGNALDVKVLLEAGIDSADLLISVMDNDEKNIICALLGKKLGAKQTIARIRTPEYSGAVGILKEELGLSMVINPEYLTANHIAHSLSIPSALDATSFFKGRIQMISLKVKEGSKLENQSLNAFSKKLNLNIIVCAIDREGKIIIPRGKEKLLANDKIHVAGTFENITKFLEYFNLISQKTKKVIISGGSKTTVYLTQKLLDLGMQVKIVEIDSERCKELSEILPKALIINGDVSDQNILYEEGIASCDAFVSLTSIDEENIVYSMFAALNDVPKIITKINHIDLDGVIEKANIDTVITPHRIAANHIVQYVRALQNSEKSSCEAVYKFDDDVFEMLEFNIKEDFKGVNKKIRDLNVRENVLIVAILRDKKIIYPSGNEEIKLHDTIIIIDGTTEVLEINDMVE